jgi:hypothetical protein
VSFGTFIKSEVSADYVLRLFNAENSPRKPGQLILAENLSVAAKTDLVEETKIEQDALAAEFQAGELLNLVITQNGKEE